TVVIDLQEGQVARPRSCRQNDVLGADRLLLSLPAGDLHLAASGEASAPFDMRDLVLLEETADSLGQPIGDLPGSLDRTGESSGDLTHVDTELVGVAEAADQRGALEQRLGGDATYIQADAAKEFLLDAGSFITELRCLDRRDIPGRSGPHEYDVEA